MRGGRGGSVCVSPSLLPLSRASDLDRDKNGLVLFGANVDEGEDCIFVSHVEGRSKASEGIGVVERVSGKLVLMWLSGMWSEMDCCWPLEMKVFGRFVVQVEVVEPVLVLVVSEISIQAGLGG